MNNQELSVTLLKIQGRSNIEQEREENPSVLKVEESLRLTLAYKMVDGNFNELSNVVNYYTHSSNFISVHTNQRMYFSLRMRENIGRLISNYATSAIALVDHTRNLVRDLYLPSNMPEYEKRVQILRTDPVIQFIGDLRNYGSHYRPIDLNTSYIFAPNGFSIELVMHSARLLEWKGWTKEAKAYLESKTSAIQIMDVIRDYQVMITEFHVWFQSEQKRILASDWIIYNEFEEKRKQQVITNVVLLLNNLAERPDPFALLTFESELASVVHFGFWETIDLTKATGIDRYNVILSSLINLGIDKKMMGSEGKKIESKIIEFI